MGDMVESLAAIRRAMERVGSGKAVDYAALEVAVGEAAAKVERASHETILQSLDVAW